MKRWIREAGRVLCTVLAVLALLVQSVLPVYADTADSESGNAGAGYTISEEENAFGLAYFDRIAVNSVKGILTIRSGDDFGIAFPSGWDEIPAFSVQDDILVVSGKKSADTRSEKSGSGSAVVIGEDEPAADAAVKAADAADSSEKSSDAAAGEDTGKDSAEVNEPAEEPAAEETAATEPATASAPAAGGTPEMVITIPAGVGLDTLRVAMEDGDLVLSDITANSVTIQSGGGNMLMRNVSLGTVDVYSDAGSIAMEKCTFGSLNIGMNKGNVSVKSGDGLSRCRMEIKTGKGGITYNGGSKGAQYLQPGNGKRFLTIQVGAGNIDISE